MHDDDDEHGTYGMIMGFVLFMLVSGMLIGASMSPAAQMSASAYTQPLR